MKKFLKKAWTLVLAVVLVFSLCVSAYAVISDYDKGYLSEEQNYYVDVWTDIWEKANFEYEMTGSQSALDQMNVAHEAAEAMRVSGILCK